MLARVYLTFWTPYPEISLENPPSTWSYFTVFFVMYLYIYVGFGIVEFARLAFLKISVWMSMGYRVPQVESSENVGATHCTAACVLHRVLLDGIFPWTLRSATGFEIFSRGCVIKRFLRYTGFRMRGWSFKWSNGGIDASRPGYLLIWVVLVKMAVGHGVRRRD